VLRPLKCFSEAKTLGFLPEKLPVKKCLLPEQDPEKIITEI